MTIRSEDTYDLSNLGSSADIVRNSLYNALAPNTNQILKAPDADFDGAPWRLIRGETKVYSTLSYDDPVTEGATYVVSPTGSDTTNTGTYASPFQSIKKALSMSDVGRVSLMPGRHIRGRAFETMSWPSDGRDISIHAPLGRAQLICADMTTFLSWSAAAGYPNVYKATVANTNGVGDYGFADDNGMPELYTKYDTVDLLSAATYGYFYGGGQIYVKTRDQTSPDADIAVFRTVAASQKDTGGLYLNNIDIHGYRLGFQMTPTVYDPNVWFMAKNTRFGFSPEGNVLSMANMRWSAMYNCVGAYGSLDVFNYHRYDAASMGRPFHVIEENCKGYWSGINAVNGSDQISTVHEDIIITRLNCEYYSSGGEVVKDQGEAVATTGGPRTKSWIVGSKFRDSRASTNNRAYVAQNGYAWIENSDLSGCTIDLLANSGGLIYCRDVRAGTVTGITGGY